MRLLVLLSLFAASAVHAQADFRGKWSFPTNMKSYCLNIEQMYLSKFKEMVENNQRLIDPNWKGDRNQLSDIEAALKKSNLADEESWHKLGCASILYPSK